MFKHALHLLRARFMELFLTSRPIDVNSEGGLFGCQGTNEHFQVLLARDFHVLFVGLQIFMEEFLDCSAVQCSAEQGQVGKWAVWKFLVLSYDRELSSLCVAWNDLDYSICYTLL